MQNRNKITSEKLFIRASVDDNQINVDERTIEVTWSTGAKGKRWNWEIGWYYEELSMKKDHVRLDRFQKGAPVLNSHKSYDLSSNMGVILSAEIKGKEGRSKVLLSGRPEVSGLVGDILQKIIRNWSVGYVVHEYLDVTKKGEAIPTLRAIDWEPMELSAVNIPFDVDSQTRSMQQGQKPSGEIFEAIITREASVDGADTTTSTDSTATDSTSEEATKTGAENKTVEQNLESENTRSMNKTDNNTPASEAITPPAKTDPSAEQVEAVRKAEMERGVEIRSVCKTAGLDEEFSERLIKDSTFTVDLARKAVLEEMDKRNKQTKTVNNNMGVKDVEQRQLRIELASNALLHRHAGNRVKLVDGASVYRGMTLLRLAEEILTAQGMNVRGMAPQEIAQRALMSSSEFVNILANVANKTLRMGYEEAPQTFDSFVRRTQVSDFKQISRTQLGDAPSLEKVNEMGEYKTGKISDAAEKYNAETYGKIVGVSRKTLINDDMDAFTRVPEMFGRAARDLESDLVYAELVSGKMADGNAICHASHNNLAASGSAIGVDSVGAGRSSMRLQVGLNGRLLNIAPKTLIVPTALETKAEQFVGPIMPNQTSSGNPFTGKLQVVAEPRLDAVSQTAWYLASVKEAIDMIELATLVGQDGPQLFAKEGFDVDGVQWKVSYDIGVKGIDYRGFYKNPGA
jgi:phage major head subunit gpT-like protein